MILNNDNYFSFEANKEYISVSQYKAFTGTFAVPMCEAKANAELEGKWVREKSTALLVGSYVDSYFEGGLEQFKKDNPEIFKRDGSLKMDYQRAEEIIKRIERDAVFSKYMSGEKQVIMTCDDLFGYGDKWKIKMDSYHPGRCIVDLKVMSNLRERKYHREINGYTTFVEEWGYDIQGAIYQEVVYRNTGKRLPFYIACVSKEKEPDIEVIWIPNDILEARLEEIRERVPNVLAIKRGDAVPMRCENCDYCRHTKVLKKPIHFAELMGELD